MGDEDTGAPDLRPTRAQVLEESEEARAKVHSLYYMNVLSATCRRKTLRRISLRLDRRLHNCKEVSSGT